MKTAFLHLCASALLLLGAGVVCRAQTTNPYISYINQWADPSPTNPNGTLPLTPEPFYNPGDTFTAWDLETNLRYALPLFWAATDVRNTATPAKKQLMLDRVEQILDNTLSLLDPTTDRWWWEGAPGRSGDPNTNRFILLALCDILHRAKIAGLYPSKMDAWLTTLQPAIDFQLASYGANSSLDFATVAAGKYANMDAAYALSLGLAARLYPGSDAAAYSASAAQFATAINTRVFPDGGTPYWMSSNEILHYHNYVVSWMSRYYEISGDPTALTFLNRASRYLPLALGNLSYLTGDFTDSSRIEVKYLDPWWKFTIDGEPTPANPSEVLASTAAIAASYATPGSLTQRQNQWLSKRLVYKTNGGINPGGHWSVKFANTCYYAVDRWAASTNEAEVLAANKLLRQSLHRGALTSPYSAASEDRYSHGFAGRFAAPNNRVFGWMAGLGDRQRTLGSAWLMNADLTRDTSLQMVSAEVRQSTGTSTSELRNVAAYHAGATLVGATITTPAFGAFGARYRPTRPWTTGTELTPANFDVRQIGLYTPSHVISFVELESRSAQSVPYIAVRVRSDRTPANPTTVNLAIESAGAGAGVGRVYAIGGLRHRLVANTLPTLAHGAAVNDTYASQSHHQRSDEFVLSRGTTTAPLSSTAFTAGEIQRAVIDTYPQGHDIASGYSLISFTGIVGFQIVIDAYRYHVLFNKGTTTVTLTNYNFHSNPGNAAVLFSSARAEVGGHSGAVPISGTTFSEPNFPPGGILVVRVPTDSYANLKSRDLGSTSFAGAHHYQPDPATGEPTVTVIGSGGAMDTSDPCHFVTTHVPAEDGALTVRLTRADRADAFAKYGIMIRSDETTAGATGLFLRYNPGQATSATGQVKMQWRTTADSSLSEGSTANLALPCWLRVSRSGNTFTAFTSTNGTTWTQLGSPTTISGFPATAFWGLAANANTHSQAGAARFERLSFVPALVPPAAPGGLVATASGTQVNLIWNAVATATTYTVKRAAAPGGPYTIIASALSAPSHTDATAKPGQTAYYIVTATNPAGEGPASTEVSALPLTALQNWRQTHFASPAATGDAADDADPDGDGLNNLLEYALGGDPHVPGDTGIPACALNPSTSSLTFTFLRLRSDLTYTVEATSDLTPPATWTVIATNPGTVSPTESVTVTDTADLSLTPRRFLRLRVTSP
ncbi:MAG: hypothetical protein H7067_03790 [Burkholderiales bacterium]|nr:hypothetical protein [Opitutaceae bacterium]